MTDRDFLGKISINADQLLSELFELAAITDAEPTPSGTSVTRVVFSPRDLEARAWFQTLAETSNLSVRVDPVGNTFARLDGTEPTLPAVATGSHIDAIPHAGMYDGTVGVLGGLEALRAIRRSGIAHRRSIELILFTSEEPTRFGIGCLGSRLLTGALSPVDAASLTDADNRTLEKVRTSAGFSGPLSDVPLRENSYHCFLELHIEQGPLLERAGIPIGVVTDIAAPATIRFLLEGTGGHAGALLMPDRHDALCAAAELILSVERSALATESQDTVATIGTCDVHPGAVNSVPSRVILQLDLRDTDPSRRDSVLAVIRQDAQEISSRRNVAIEEDLINKDCPAHSSPRVVSVIDEICRDLGVPSLRMVSRAYHDTLFIARSVPIAMIFVPSRGGVSHRPDEYTAPTNIVRGTEILALTLTRLACE